VTFIFQRTYFLKLAESEMTILRGVNAGELALSCNPSYWEARIVG
jgi:hypothetical protein